MKGLLLKDWFMMKKYCKSNLLIAVVFIGVSFFSDDNLFVLFYPCMLCGMVPASLLAYDERSHWTQYSGTLPYTKEQIVSAKYIVGLLTQLAVVTVTAAAQTARTVGGGTFHPGELAVLMLIFYTVSTLASAIPLPFIFKYGAEKGRLAYYVMIGFVCCVAGLASTMLKGQNIPELKPNLAMLLLAAAGIAVYALSWYLSVVFYKRREI